MHEMPSRIPQDTALLAYRTSQEHKAAFPPPQVHHPRLLRMQRQTQLAHHKLDPPKSLLRLRLRRCHHHEVVGISDQNSERTAFGCPQPIQQVQVDCNVPQSSPPKEGSVFRFSVDECLDEREK